MKKIYNCYRCWGNLYECSDTIASIWLDMCECENGSGYLNFVEDNGIKYELMWMEDMGYVVTRETPECTQVRLIGREVVDDGVRYCANRSRHEEMQ